MQESRIVLELNGRRGPADLSDFATAVGALRNSLRNVWRCAVGNDDMEYEISDLRYGSAVVATAPAPGLEADGAITDTLYEATVFALQNALPLDPRIDYQALHAFNGFSSIAKKPEASLKLGAVLVTSQYARRVSELLEPDTSSRGSVTGRLEGLSVHSGSKFTLYPPIDGEQVECDFQHKDLPDVLLAVEKIVTVYGVLHYTKMKAFPVRVDVDAFEVVEQSQFPTLLNACGLLRSANPSVSMIREIRDEWRD